MQGYANPSQIAGGILTRLYARAFIVADPKTPENRIVFVNLDACMAAQAVTFTLLRRLQDRYGPDLYSEQNVILSGTHTHSGPAGYLQYVVYDITGLGFVQETFDALVTGIEHAVVRAHESLAPGQLFVATGELLDANVNRSPTAYVMNPEEERAEYSYDVDKIMTVLGIENSSGTPLGAFSWFPVHGTSMNNTNRLVNGDNKGAAAQFMERWAAQQDWEQDRQPSERALSERSPSTSLDVSSKAPSEFIAAFCQANVGDTSPNTLGPVCMDTGEPCDAVHSTCGGRVAQCIGRGPAFPNHQKSTRIIGQKQADKAQELLMNKSGRVDIAGPIESRHIFLDMRNLQVEASNFTRCGQTCVPAMGFAFAAGTTDGPGAFDFEQSDTNGTTFWRLVRDFLHTPTREQEACHAPKPILLDVGEMHFPYEWVPYIVEIQIVRIGQMVILAVPGEFTTMAGRRLRKAVADAVGDAWGDDVHYVIAGLSNTYSSYITTYEEYSVQRYEGGFTLFGPHTLDAYIQEFRKLAMAMVKGEPTETGPQPPDLLSKQWSLVPGVVADGVPEGVIFGDRSQDVENKVYYPGDVVQAEFHSGCPRNDVRAEGTFLTVERLVDPPSLSSSSIGDTISLGQHQIAGFFRRYFAWLLPFSPTKSATAQPQQESDEQPEPLMNWQVVHTDHDWETKFIWERHRTFSTNSFATVVWEIPDDVIPGMYRLRHFGNYKHFLGEVFPFEGTSSTFEVRKGKDTYNNVFTRVINALGRRARAFRT